MKKALSITLIFVAALACANPVPREWKDRYQSLVDATNSKNLTLFKSMFAKDFVTIDEKGHKGTREEFFKEVDGIFAGASKVSAKIDLKSVKTHGDMADVSFDFKLKVTRKKGSMMVHEIGVDTWKKIGGKWLTVKTVDSKLTMTEPK